MLLRLCTDIAQLVQLDQWPVHEDDLVSKQARSKLVRVQLAERLAGGWSMLLPTADVQLIVFKHARLCHPSKDYCAGVKQYLIRSGLLRGQRQSLEDA